MYLLDVTVLLAFAYKGQVSHWRVTHWIKFVESNGSEGPLFATCSIVELGFVRIAAGKSRLAENLTIARADLQRLKTELHSTLLADEVDGNRLPVWVTKSRQTTDGHLLELATAHHAQLATLDTGIPGAVLIPERIVPPFEVREPLTPYGAATLAGKAHSPYGFDRLATINSPAPHPSRESTY